ncbi:MAG TPA: proton-conducting transporter membrane subunit, partial [Geobacteraceae bacterium]
KTGVFSRPWSPAAGGSPGTQGRTPQRLAAVFVAAGAVCGLIGSLWTILGGRSSAYLIDWGLPFGRCEVAIDPLSAFFLLPVFIVSTCCAVYYVRYWPAGEHPETARKLTFFFGLMVAAMTQVVMARNMVLFLIAWEVMALAAYFLLAAESDKKEVRESGFIYLAATHTGTLALFAMFSLLHGTTASFGFPAAASLDAAAPLAAAIVITALLGFGMKAGIMPLHIWLPTAHANAPSHISAIMSGVVIKMGVYGLVRTLSFFTHEPLWWGTAILAAGAMTAILGIAFAFGQEDIKRLLAYSSIENIGIVTMGVGVAVIGQATANTSLIMLGMGGALLHVLNHSLFKPLLFLNAGALIHAAGSREIDAMGGLARSMPLSALFFLTGAVAICGLPPLNGFVGEYLIYLGFFTGVQEGTGAAPFLAMAVPSLALVGGLAAACFLKVYGMAFLGQPRSQAAANAHEADRLLLAPMGLLATLCIGIGLCPLLAQRLLSSPLRAWSPLVPEGAQEWGALAPVGWITVTGLSLLAVIMLLTVLLRHRLGRAPSRPATTWGCGYAAPSARMQYTASSFSDILVQLFRRVLHPRASSPELHDYFPVRRGYTSSIPDLVLDLFILPTARVMDHGFSFVRKLQHGAYHFYILYILITLVALFLWAR